MRGRLLSEVRCGSVSVMDVAYDGGSVLREHQHEKPYVSLLIEGEYTELRDEIPRRCIPGTAILHRPREVHADVFALDGRCINFEPRADASVESILQVAAATYPKHRQSIGLALTRPARGIEETAHVPDWLKRVFAEFNWIEAVPLKSASRIAGMHNTHFVRAFRKHTGITPGSFRRRERIRAASKLLLNSSMSLSGIAQECGFCDQSHLTNVFHASTGVAPRLYRDAFAR